MATKMDTAKAFLRQTNADGVSVYSHLTEVLATLLQKQPDNALDMLEGVSLECKKKHYSPEGTAAPEAPAEVPPPLSDVEQASSAWHEANAKLLGKPSGDEDAAPEGEVTDILAERAMFECAGIGLSKEETYRVYAALLQLQQTKQLATVRFFGKVLGTEADYYVAECTGYQPPDPDPDADPEPEPPADAEPAGSGCNAFTYFVTNDPASEWTVLPDVKPKEIVASKLIRKFLTGKLDASVRAYPPYPGDEKVYLRSLLALISAATILVPHDMLVKPEDAEAGWLPAPNEAEDYKAAAPDACQWVTKYYGVLDIGRTTNLPVEEEEPEEGEEKRKGPEPQAHIEPLSPISEDAWSTAVYTHGGPSVAIARSALFPGACCAYKLAGTEPTVASIYIGYGHPTLPAPFKMQPPPMFQREPDELLEQEDPPLEEENEPKLKAAQAELDEEVAAAESAGEGE